MLEGKFEESYDTVYDGCEEYLVDSEAVENSLAIISEPIM